MPLHYRKCRIKHFGGLIHERTKKFRAYSPQMCYFYFFFVACLANLSTTDSGNNQDIFSHVSTTLMYMFAVCLSIFVFGTVGLEMSAWAQRTIFTIFWQTNQLTEKPKSNLHTSHLSLNLYSKPKWSEPSKLLLWSLCRDPASASSFKLGLPVPFFLFFLLFHPLCSSLSWAPCPPLTEHTE